MIESDEALVGRSQRGDRLAFEELVRRTARLVFSRLCLETGRADWAEDLSQETYLVAWRSIAQLTAPAGFRPWLVIIARSVAVDAMRRESRQKRSAVRLRGREEGDFLAGLPDSQPPPPESAQREEGRRQVLDVLRGLPEDYRQPLTLRYLAGADYPTIAAQLGLTSGSLRGLLNRGMAMLRQRMKAADLDPDRARNAERTYTAATDPGPARDTDPPYAKPTPATSTTPTTPASAPIHTRRR